MKKIIKIAAILLISICPSFFNSNGLKAQNSPNSQCTINEIGSGKILSLNPGLKSGLLLDDTTGEIKEFHYAGLEVLEINAEYIYIVQVKVSGKIIIRDIHKK